MIAYTRERRTRCRAMLKRGWGRVPLLLSMGNAGVRARTKRITACMPRRAPTWTERTRKDNVARRRKRGNGRTIVPTSERASERVNERTNERTFHLNKRARFSQSQIFNNRPASVWPVRDSSKLVGHFRYPEQAPLFQSSTVLSTFLIVRGDTLHSAT